MWWPGTSGANNLAATDVHNYVIGDLVPELPLTPAMP